MYIIHNIYCPYSFNILVVSLKTVITKYYYSFVILIHIYGNDIPNNINELNIQFVLNFFFYSTYDNLSMEERKQTYYIEGVTFQFHSVI